MRPGSRLRDTRSTAVTPPKRLRTRSISRIGGISALRTGAATSVGKPRLDRPREVVLLLEDAEDAPRHEEHDGDDDGAEEELVEVDEAGPHQLLKGEQEDGAQHGAPDGPLAAKEGHHDHGDRRDEGEYAGGLDVALVPGGQPANYPGRHRREEERVELVAEGIDAHRL